MSARKGSVDAGGRRRTAASVGQGLALRRPGWCLDAPLSLFGGVLPLPAVPGIDGRHYFYFQSIFDYLFESKESLGS